MATVTVAVALEPTRTYPAEVLVMLASGATPVPVRVIDTELLPPVVSVATSTWLKVPVEAGENVNDAVTLVVVEPVVELIALPLNGAAPAPTVRAVPLVWPLTVTSAVWAVVVVPTRTSPKEAGWAVVTDTVAYAPRPSSRRSANNEVADASDDRKLKPYLIVTKIA